MADETANEATRERRGLLDYFKESWAQAIVAVNAAEEDAGGVLGRVGDLAGWRPDDAKRLAMEFGERLTRQRKELETSLEDQVARTLARMKVPRRDEIELLRGRVEAIATRIDALRSRRG